MTDDLNEIDRLMHGLEAAYDAASAQAMQAVPAVTQVAKTKKAAPVAPAAAERMPAAPRPPAAPVEAAPKPVRRQPEAEQVTPARGALEDRHAVTLSQVSRQSAASGWPWLRQAAIGIACGAFLAIGLLLGFYANGQAGLSAKPAMAAHMAPLAPSAAQASPTINWDAATCALPAKLASADLPRQDQAANGAKGVAPLPVQKPEMDQDAAKQVFVPHIQAVEAPVKTGRKSRQSAGAQSATLAPDEPAMSAPRQSPAEIDQEPRPTLNFD